MKVFKFILLIFVWLNASLSFATDNTKYNAFVNQVLPCYHSIIQKTHAKNQYYVNNNIFDSIRTNFVFDFKNWNYNDTKNQWTFVNDDQEFTGVNFTSSQYFYENNLETGTSFANAEDLTNVKLQEFYQWQRTTNADMAVKYYTVTIHNVPLLYYNPEKELSYPDTNLSLYQVLKSNIITSDEMYNCFRAQNDEIGKKLFETLSTFETEDEFTLLVCLYSQNIPANGKYHRFRFLNYYHEPILNENLKDALSYNLNLFQYNKNLNLDDAVENGIQSIKCYVFEECSDLALSFNTSQAKLFWTNFMNKKDEIFDGLTDSEKEEKMAIAIKVATTIDALTDRTFAEQICQNGLCYLKEVYCGDNAEQNNNMLFQAALLTYGGLREMDGVTIINNTELFNLFNSDSPAPGQIKFQLKLSKDNGIEQEVEIELSNTMSREYLVDLLCSFGLDYTNNYQFWLFKRNAPDTYTNLIIYIENHQLESPPFVVQLLASILIGPINSAQGMFSHVDLLTKEELTGLDYVFNTLDLIPGGSFVGDIGGMVFKKVLVKTPKKIWNIAEKLPLYKAYKEVNKGINVLNNSLDAFHESCSKLIYTLMAKSKNLVYETTNKFVKVLNNAGEELAIIKGNKISISSSKISEVTNGKGIAVDNGADVYIDGTKTTDKIEFVELDNGDVTVRRVVGEGRILSNKPSWLPNRIISGNINNPKGLIGVYDKNIPGIGVIDDTKRMLYEIDYPLCNVSNFTTESKDGFKMLNVPNDAVDMWTTYNKPWIEALTGAKAEVVVLSDKNNELLKFVLKKDGSGAFETLPNGEKILTGFGKEINFMDELVNKGLYHWDGVNGIYKAISN